MRNLFGAWLVFTIVWVGAICWIQYPNWTDLGGTTFCDCDRVAFTRIVTVLRVIDWLPLMLLPPGPCCLRALCSFGWQGCSGQMLSCAGAARWAARGFDLMTIELSVNGHSSRVASVSEFRRALIPFASEQFREIYINIDKGGSALFALLNRSTGWLMYLRHYGDAGFSSRNPAFDASATAHSSSGSVSRFNGVVVPVIEYRLSNGQVDQYPASWALSEKEVMRALEYFVEHGGARAPFVVWNDDGKR